MYWSLNFFCLLYLKIFLYLLGINYMIHLAMLLQWQHGFAVYSY